MTNLEYIQQLGKKKGLKFLRGICPGHPCHDCEFERDGNACAAYMEGARKLAEWLFAKYKEENKGRTCAFIHVIREACCANCRWMYSVYAGCGCGNPLQSENYVYGHYICDLFERREE